MLQSGWVWGSGNRRGESGGEPTSPSIIVCPKNARAYFLSFVPIVPTAMHRNLNSFLWIRDFAQCELDPIFAKLPRQRIVKRHSTTCESVKAVSVRLARSEETAPRYTPGRELAAFRNVKFARGFGARVSSIEPFLRRRGIGSVAPIGRRVRGTPIIRRSVSSGRSENSAGLCPV
jgi:hypothetical protein